jgi:hypothetical protein
MWWPGRRRRKQVDLPSSTGQNQSLGPAEQAQPPAWTTLPPLQPTRSEPPTVARLQSFGGTLSSHHDPRFLEPLGHYVLSGAPGGRVDGFATPRPAVQRWLGPNPSPAPIIDGDTSTWAPPRSSEPPASDSFRPSEVHEIGHVTVPAGTHQEESHSAPSAAPIIADAAFTWASPRSSQQSAPDSLRPAEVHEIGHDNVPAETRRERSPSAPSVTDHGVPTSRRSADAATAAATNAEPPGANPLVAPIAAQRSAVLGPRALADHLPQARPLPAESVVRAPAGRLPAAHVREVAAAEPPAFSQRALDAAKLENAPAHTRAEVRAGERDGAAASSSAGIVATLGAASGHADTSTSGNVPLRQAPVPAASPLPIQRAVIRPASPPAAQQAIGQLAASSPARVEPRPVPLPRPELTWPQQEAEVHPPVRSLPVLPLGYGDGTSSRSEVGTEELNAGRPAPAPSVYAPPPVPPPPVQRVEIGEPPRVTGRFAAPTFRRERAMALGSSRVLQRQLAPGQVTPGQTYTCRDQVTDGTDRRWRPGHPQSAAPLHGTADAVPTTGRPLTMEWRSGPVQRTVQSEGSPLPAHGSEAPREAHAAGSRTPLPVAGSFAPRPEPPPTAVQASPDRSQEVPAEPATDPGGLDDSATVITATVATPAGTALGAPPASTAGTPNLDELARRLYEPLSARLRAELWLDRERTGRTLSR